MGEVRDEISVERPNSKANQRGQAFYDLISAIQTRPSFSQPLTTEKLVRIPRVLKAIYQRKPFVPQTLEICATSACNLRCATCIDKKAMAEMPGRISLTAILRTVKHALELGVPSFKFAGFGEPTLLGNDLTEAFKYIGRYRKPISLITNGALLQEGLIEALVRYGSEYRVSLATLDERAFGRLMNPKDTQISAASTLSNIKALLQRRAEDKGSNLLVGVSVLLYPHTYEALPSLIDTLKDFGVDYIMIKPTLTDNGALGFEDGGFPGLEDLPFHSTTDTAVMLTNERLSTAEYGRPFEQCLAGGIAPMVLPNGEAGEGSLWLCGRGKGREGFKLNALQSPLKPKDVATCPPVCKEDAYNIALGDHNIKDDILTRGTLRAELEQSTDVYGWLHAFLRDHYSPRLMYIRRRAAELASVSDCHTSSILEWAIAGAHALGRDPVHMLDTHSLDDNVFEFIASDEDLELRERFNIYRNLHYCTKRILSPNRLTNMYNFF